MKTAFEKVCYSGNNELEATDIRVVFSRKRNILMAYRVLLPKLSN